MKKAVVVLSGGMDSALCLAIAKERGYEVHTMHLNYGQLTQDREEEAFNALSDHYGAASRKIIDTEFFKQLGGSSLVGDGVIPESTELEEGMSERSGDDVPSTYVPFRNGIILSLASAWADLIKADTIFIGAVEEDSSGYPDCRTSFISDISSAIRRGTANGVTVTAPLLKMTKKDIVKEGRRMGLPFELTWSCYQSETEPCGRCESCLLRAKGFESAGTKDPLLEK